jgi:hypothetical protein
LLPAAPTCTTLALAVAPLWMFCHSTIPVVGKKLPASPQKSPLLLDKPYGFRVYLI